MQDRYGGGVSSHGADGPASNPAGDIYRKWLFGKVLESQFSWGRIFGPKMSDITDALGLRNRNPTIDELITTGFYKLKPLSDLQSQMGEHNMFASVAEAEDFFGDDLPPGWEPRHGVYRSFSEEKIAAECNEVWVVGVDPIAQAPIRARYVNRDAQDPLLSVTARKENWAGEPRVYGYFSSQLVSYAACVRGLKTLVPRITNMRRVATIEADMQRYPDGRPVWRGAMITIDGKGYYEAKSFGGPIDRTMTEEALEGDGDATNYASMTYVMERLYSWDRVSDTEVD